MKKYIEKLVNQTREKYLKDYSEIIRDYNHENETVKSYNGRQILELLQNCDDEGSKEVLIELNKKNKEISIHNKGTAFSKKGYRSLFIPNLSSKRNKIRYIGNKGLGFRSIINWCDALEIRSNNLALKYSEERRSENFNLLYNKEQQSRIKEDESIRKSVIPFPFLTLPEVIPWKQKDYVTNIVIKYKKNEYDNIISQIKSISPETILFLNSIEKIYFRGFEQSIRDIKTNKKHLKEFDGNFSPCEKIIYDNITWYIFKKENYFGRNEEDEKEYYQIKIAVEENMEKKVQELYSFFPTKIYLKQPYILHATFELDSTRYQLVESDKNKIMLKKVAEFTKRVAEYYASRELSYRPLKILYHHHQADTLSGLGYYKLIEELIDKTKILPCVDGSYKTIEDSIYISDEFAEMISQIKAEEIFDFHILPLEGKSLRDYGLENKLDTKLDILNNITKLINDMSSLDLTIGNRALFIEQIIKNAGFIKEKYENKINVFVNDENQLIKGNEYIYTPVTKKNELQTPSYTDIQFINKKLFEALLSKFSFKESGSQNKSRFIYEQLAGYCNVHSYEPATLAQKIISETNKEIKKRPAKAILIIKEMNQCLLYNFQQLEEGTRLPENTTAPTITKSKKIKNIDEVMLSDSYPTGSRTEIIFEGLYSDDDYIDAPEGLGFDSEKYNIKELEYFLQWLGVNEYARYKKKIFTQGQLEGYYHYINSIEEDYIDRRYKTTVTYMDDIDYILKNITIDKFIFWIYCDKTLRKQINDSENNDSFEYLYYYWRPISCPSYIKYKIKDIYQYSFEDYLILDSYYWVNEFRIDYKSRIFVEHGISKSEINSILLILGASDEFNDLSIEKVTDILSRLPEIYSDGGKTQTVYKQALSHYKTNKKILTKKVKIFADDGLGLKAYEQKDVYFSDKIKLPKNLRRYYPIFNFPSRAGGVDAIEFFQINDLKNVHIDIISHKRNMELTKTFTKKLDSIRPLILAHRLSVLEDSTDHKRQASICNSIEIIICNKIVYKIKNQTYEVEDYEFVHQQDNTYYIKVKEKDIYEEILTNRLFINSCADIISLSLDVRSDRTEYKQFIKNDIKEAVEDVISDVGEDTYNQAMEILGLSNNKQAFWKAIFEASGNDYIEQLDDIALEELIKNTFNLKYDVSSIDYDNVNSSSELLKIKELLLDIGLTISEFNEKYLCKISFKDFYQKDIKNEILSKKNMVKAALWNKFKQESIEAQSSFLSEVNKYENFFEYVENTSIKNQYEFSINLNAIFKEYIKNIYGSLDIPEDYSEKYLQIRENNLKEIDDDELYQINQSEKLKSLLYFEKTIDTIKNDLIRDDSDIEVENKEEPSPPLEIIDSENLKLKGNENEEKPKNKGGAYTPKEESPKKRKKIGDISEKMVYDYLMENDEYYNIDHISKDNEGLHYDIRYTNKNGEVKYIEVKTFNNGEFYLSKEQYDFGIKEKNNYEIWLVLQKKRKIIPIKDFFTNSKYNPVVYEYKVSLDIEELAIE